MDNNKLLGYLEAKIDELHTDVKDIKVEVAELREDFIQRKTVYKVALWLIGILTTTVGWLISHVITKIGLH